MIQKAMSHKYIRKELKNGVWEYIYEDAKNKGKLSINDTKKFGHSGKFIKTTASNPAMVTKGIKNWLSQIGQKFEYNESRTTSSRYFELDDKFDNHFKLRVANHSPAISYEEEWEGIKISEYNDNTLDVKIDTSYGFNTNDIKNIVEIVQQTNEELKGKKVKIGFDELYSTKVSELIDKKLEEYGVEEDYYGINKKLIKDRINSQEWSKEYREFKEEKKKVESKSKINETVSLSNGIGITIKDNWVNDVVFPESYAGSKFKKERKEIKDKIQYTLGNILREGKMTLEDFKKQSEDIITNKYIASIKQTTFDKAIEADIEKFLNENK